MLGPDELNRICEAVIGCAFKVQNTLGIGFLEKVYENALAYEIRTLGFQVQQQEPVKVMYDGIVVGDYFADILVNGELILELKTVKAFDATHLAQCLNYLKATGHRLCLLMNFNEPRVGIKRIANGL